MKLLVDVRRYLAWELKHQSEVGEDDISIPSHFGENLRHVRTEQEGPNTVEIHLPDSDIDRMEEDHRLGVENARKGYTAIHEGGPQHGQEVEVAPRVLPLKSRNQLIAEHLSNVLGGHVETRHISRIRVAEPALNADGEPEDQSKLERFLNRQFVEEPDEDDEEPKPARRRAAKEAEEE